MELLGEPEFHYSRGSSPAVAPQSQKATCKGWLAPMDAALKIIKDPIAGAVLKVVEAIGDALSSALKCPHNRVGNRLRTRLADTPLFLICPISGVPF